MPTAELAQYGIGFFAVAGLIFVVARYFDSRSNNELAEVIQNNTKALEQVTAVVQAIQLSLTRQEAKIDEILERARR
jgi:peptidoglycan hydrolase CwlO-like protein